MVSGGILIIGSLLWDSSQRRVNWRNKCLQINETILVNAPIRYGRISSSRNCTFTMVFSSECIDVNKCGQAAFIPFVNNPINLESLEQQSKELIRAETDKDKISSNLDWKWGALTICFNPNSLKNLEKSTHLQEIINTWSEKYSTEFEPNKYKLEHEAPLMDKKGVLNITWPSQLEDYDFLIATATMPNIEVYPTANKIADRITVNEYSEYFTKNSEHHIKTFQDSEIHSLINSKL